MDTFQSTRPIRGATRSAGISRLLGYHFNPRAPYGARLYGGAEYGGAGGISIHAPHTGRDMQTRAPQLRGQNFNPRANLYGVCPFYSDFNPRAPYGARLVAFLSGPAFFVFQSTRPIRGATLIFPASVKPFLISIHAPHTGRDNKYEIGYAWNLKFQSTRPIRGATDL